MMRINLLPPEILDKRRAEKRIGYVIIAAVGVAIILAAVWAFGYFRLQGKQDELAVIQQQVQATQSQANQLAIFEERAGELAKRQAIVALALSDRRNWAKLFDELSLVLPEDVWVQTLTAAEASGLQLVGYAIDAPNDSPDVGHKSIAKTLVRLADLEQLYDVWLTNSVKQPYQEQDAIQFTVTAQIHKPSAEGTTP
jgi:Tfp pilus assembly protein PilN